MFTFRFNSYRIFQYLLIFIFVSSEVIAGQTPKKCAAFNEYCQNHWDCCSNSCMSYLYRCSRGYNVYPYPFLGVSYKPSVTLDQILEQNFGSSNNIPVSQPKPVNQPHPMFASRFGVPDDAGTTEVEIVLQTNSEEDNGISTTLKNPVVLQESTTLRNPIVLELSTTLKNLQTNSEEGNEVSSTLKNPVVLQESTTLRNPIVLELSTTLKNPSVLQESTTLKNPVVLQEPTAVFENRIGEEVSDTQKNDNDVGQTTQATISTSTNDKPSCSEIGVKCYRNEECCTQRCHGFLHQCVT